MGISLVASGYQPHVSVSCYTFSSAGCWSAMASLIQTPNVKLLQWYNHIFSAVIFANFVPFVTVKSVVDWHIQHQQWERTPNYFYDCLRYTNSWVWRALVDSVLPIGGCAGTNLKWHARVNTYLLAFLIIYFLLHLDGWKVVCHNKHMIVGQVCSSVRYTDDIIYSYLLSTWVFGFWNPQRFCLHEQKIRTNEYSVGNTKITATFCLTRFVFFYPCRELVE